MGEHLAAVRRITGKEVETHATTQCPPELRYLWEDFAKLCSKRVTDGMGGVLPIRYAEMLDYCAAKKLPQFAAWEVDALDLLDAVWRGVRNEAVKKQEEAAKRNQNV